MVQMVVVMHRVVQDEYRGCTGDEIGVEWAVTLVGAGRVERECRKCHWVSE